MANENSATKSEIKWQNNDKKYRENRNISRTQEGKKLGIQEYRNVRNQEIEQQETGFSGQQTAGSGQQGEDRRRNSGQQTAGSGQELEGMDSRFRGNEVPENWSLAEEIRTWVCKNNWVNRDEPANSLKFKRAFGHPVTSLTGQLFGDKRIRLATHIKTEYDRLLTEMDSHDDLCEKRCYDDDEDGIRENIRVRLKLLTNNLADLIAGHCRLPLTYLAGRGQERLKTEAQRKPPIKIVEIPAAEKKSLPAENAELKSPLNRKRRTRTASSDLSEIEKQVYAAIRVQGKTIAQAAIEFNCSPQNISKHHNNAERKMNAKKSRSANTSYRLPEDDRGQISLG